MSSFQNITTKRLGLAAFMHIRHCELISASKEKGFTFRSDLSISQWEIEYANSCCSKHDAAVCELRKFYR